ncbi:MAG: exo-alpha-sialidase, partial [Phycisphaerales bacterium]
MSVAKAICVLVVGCLVSVAAATAAEVPGVVMAYSPPSSQIYIGSPGLAVCPDGTYVAKYDDCGEGSSEWTSAVTRVLRSRDHGASWEPAA